MEIKRFYDESLAHASYAILVKDQMALVDPARDPRPYDNFEEERGAQIVDSRSRTVAEAEDTGRFTRSDNDVTTSLKFQLVHSKMAKLELLCKQEDVTTIVQIFSEYGGTGE